MPCPFFFPTHRCPEPLWPHPERLPLGDGYVGRCTAPGHEALAPTGVLLHDCNLGYADCSRLPAERPADAVRFSWRRESRQCVAVRYVCEVGHAPVAHGILIFDGAAGQWRERHPDARIQRMAECCIEACGKEQ